MSGVAKWGSLYNTVLDALIFIPAWKQVQSAPQLAKLLTGGVSLIPGVAKWGDLFHGRQISYKTVSLISDYCKW